MSIAGVIGVFFVQCAVSVKLSVTVSVSKSQSLSPSYQLANFQPLRVGFAGLTTYWP